MMRTKRTVCTVLMCLLLLVGVICGMTVTAASAESDTETVTTFFTNGETDVERVFRSNIDVTEGYTPFTQNTFNGTSKNVTLLYKLKSACATDASGQTALRLKLGIKNVSGLNNARIQFGLMNSNPSQDSKVSAYQTDGNRNYSGENPLDSYGIRWYAGYSDFCSTLTNGEMTVALALNDTTHYVWWRNDDKDGDVYRNVDEAYLKGVDTIGIRIYYEMDDSRYQNNFQKVFRIDLKSAEFVSGVAAADVCGVTCDTVRQESVALYNGDATGVTAYNQRNVGTVSDYTRTASPYGTDYADKDMLTMTRDFGTNTLAFTFPQSVDASSFRHPAIKMWIYLDASADTLRSYNMQLGVFSSEDAMVNGVPKTGDNLLDRYGVRIQKNNGTTLDNFVAGWNLIVLPYLGSTSTSYCGFQVNNEVRTMNTAALDGFAFRAHSGSDAYTWGIYSIEIVDLESYDNGVGIVQTRATADTVLDGITLDSETVALTAAQPEKTLTYTVSKQYVSDAQITWQSSDTSVVTVDNGGKLTAVGNGQATVTVTAKQNETEVSDAVTVNVTGIKMLTSIAVTNKAVTLGVGKNSTVEYTLQGNNFEQNADNGVSVVLTSSDTTVASVEGNRITGVSGGTATITVTATLNGVEKTDTVAVTVWSFDSVNIAAVNNSYGVGAEFTLNVTLHGVNLDETVIAAVGGKTVQYESSSAAATVTQDGKVTTVSAADEVTVTVTVTVDGVEKSASVTFAVIDSFVFNGVSFAQTELLLAQSQTHTLAVNYDAPNLGDREIVQSFTSSDEAVINVANAGVITAVGTGTATVTVTVTIAGTTKTATCAVTVWAFTGITVDDTEVILGVEGTHTIVVTDTGTNLDKGQTKSTTFVSDNTEVIIVSNEGVVTAISGGTATVAVTRTVGGVERTATVQIAVWTFDGVEVDVAEQNIEIGDNTQKITYCLKGINLDSVEKNAAFVSDDTDTVTVVSDGTVSAVGIGNAVITVTVQIGQDSKQAQTNICVVQSLLRGVTLTNDSLTISDRAPVTLGYVLDKTDADGVTVTWTVNGDCVSVTEGVVSAVANGTATVTVTATQGYNAYSDSVEITVAGLSVFTGVSLDEGTVTLKVDGTHVITYTLVGDNVASAIHTVTFVSDNETVATVDENGKITAVSVGTASVTVTVTVDGTEKQTTLSVTVEAAQTSGQDDAPKGSGCRSSVAGNNGLLAAILLLLFAGIVSVVKVSVKHIK